MKIKYFCTTWGMESLPREELFRRMHEAGYDGVEMGVPADQEERRRLRSLLREHQLDFVAQQWTTGPTPEAHAASFEEQYRRAVELEPLLVNSHTGKDSYSTGQNLVIMRRAQALEEELRLPVTHETHRGRSTFCIGATCALLEALPSVRLDGRLLPLVLRP